MKNFYWKLAGSFLLLVGIGCMTAEASKEFQFTMLSKGAGVPEETRVAFAQAESLLLNLEKQGVALSWKRERVGLEGETRVCVRFEDQDSAQKAFQKIKQMGSENDYLLLEPFFRCK